MVTQESFGNLVRGYRRDAELSQEALAERAGLSVRAIRDIETGSQRRPRLDTVQLLLAALAVPDREQAAFLAAAAGQGRAVLPAAEGEPVAGTPASAQLLTILIADMRGFTAYAVEHGDEAGAHLADRFGVTTTAVVGQYGGRVVELRGDEALCAFASARQALRAALALQEEYQPGEKRDGLPLGVGIGLDAGEIVPVQGGYRGRALNLAARLCSLAAGGEVLASESVLHLAGTVEDIRTADRGPVTVKGVPEPVRVINVGREGGDASTAAAATGGGTGRVPQQHFPTGGFAGSLPVGPMVGREGELSHLLQVVDAVVQGDGRLALLAGEPGVGKTRLLQGVTAAVDERGFLVAAGRCYEPEQNVPYYPFLDAVAILWALAPAEVRADAARRWPHLGALLPEEIPVPPASAAGQDEQQQVFRAVTGFLEAMTQIAPIALLLDDLHWADGSSLKLLRHIATHTRASSLLLLGTYRDVEVGRQHPLEGVLLDLRREGLAETIPIRRLSSEGTAALVSAALRDDAVPPAFSRRLHARTEGNPFFTKQVLDMLVQRDDGTRHEVRWDRRAVEEIEIPESIRAAVGRRLTRLSAATQEILHEAGVLGQRFQFDDLKLMSGRSEAELEDALSEACEQRLLAVTGRDEYGFDHVLTQQVLNAELPARRKRRLHLAAGEMLERLPEARRGERIAELAWHFQQADEPEKAMRYTLAAGDHAAQVFAHDEAEQQYLTALKLARELGKRESEAAALEWLGRVLKITGRYDESLEVLEDSAAVYRAVGDLLSEIRTVGAIADAHFLRGASSDSVARVAALLDALEGQTLPPGTARLLVYQAANGALAGHLSFTELLSQCERLSHLAQAEGDTGAFLLAEAYRGFALHNVGRVDEALQVLEAAAPLAEGRADEDSRHVLDCLAQAYLWNGHQEQARGLLKRMIAAYEKQGDNDLIAFFTAEIGESYFAEGDWHQARLYYEQAMRIRNAESRSWNAVLPPARFAELSMREGKWAEAEELLDETLAVARINQDGQWLRLAHGLLIECALLQGQRDQALAFHDGLMDDPDQRDKLVMPSPALAMLFLALGDVDRADGLIERGIEYWIERLGRERSDPALWDLIAVQGQVLAARGQWAEADAAFHDALTGARSTRYVLSEAQALQWHGEMLAARGDVNRARQRLQQARGIYLRVGAAPYIRQTEEALARLAL